MGLLSCKTLREKIKTKIRYEKSSCGTEKIRSDICLLVKKVQQDRANTTMSLIDL
jgi:hypothetical protein